MFVHVWNNLNLKISSNWWKWFSCFYQKCIKIVGKLKMGISGAFYQRLLLSFVRQWLMYFCQGNIDRQAERFGEVNHWTPNALDIMAVLRIGIHSIFIDISYKFFRSHAVHPLNFAGSNKFLRNDWPN